MSAPPLPVQPVVNAALGNSQPVSQVELRLSCMDLPNLDFFSKTDCCIYVYLIQDFSPTQHSKLQQNRNNGVLIGQTEVIKNSLNPIFSTSIKMDYYFEREQRLRFLLIDIDSSSKPNHI